MRLALTCTVLLASLAGNLWAGWEVTAQYDGGAGANGYYSHGYGCPGHYNGGSYSNATTRYRYTEGSVPFVRGSGPGYNFGTSIPSGYFGNTTGSWSTSSNNGFSGYYSSGGGWGGHYQTGGTGFSFGSR